MTEKEFEIIPGTNNIILVAPHGNMKKPRDDERTAELARLIQDKLKCYAVINEVYRKPRVKDKTRFDITKKICNLNYIDDYKDTPLYEQFVGPIKQFKKEITERGETLYIFHIHGASTNRFNTACKEVHSKKPQDVTVLIGTGRGVLPKSGDESLTAPATTVDKLIKYLKEEQILAYSTNSESYTAKKEHNLNQLFRKHDSDEKVISFQLEIRKKNFRDTSENVAKTATRLSAVIEHFAVVIPTVEAEIVNGRKTDDKAIVPTKDKQPDILLVETAYNQLRDIIVRHYEKARAEAMLEAGQYIVTTFYDNDFQRAKEKKSNKQTTLNQLIKKLQEQSGGAPSKTWFYDVVGLAVDAHELKGFGTYEDLSISHKIKLTTYRGETKGKEKLIQEKVKKSLSVRQFTKRVKEENEKIEGGPTLAGVISDPDKLFSAKCKSIHSKAALAALEPALRSNIQNRIMLKKQKLQEQISKQQEFLKRYEGLMSDLTAMDNEATEL